MIHHMISPSQVNRDYVVECFFHKNPVLKDLVEYRFEPHDKDTVTVINKDHGAEIFLEKDARKWAMKLVKHQSSIGEIRKQIKGLKSVTSAYTKVCVCVCVCERERERERKGEREMYNISMTII